MRRRGLGRGLDALLPSQEGGLEAHGGLTEVAVDAIAPNPRQPRREFSEESLRELAASIRQLGLLQPLLVRDLGDQRYELIAGERRLRAARLAGLQRIPALVVETDDRGSLERAIVENLHREDLNPIEEAAAYRQLIDEGGLTQEALGERLGRNRVTISNTLRLLDLPTKIQRFVAEGRMTAGHGRALLSLQGNPFQQRLAQRVVHEGLSVRETEEQARKYQRMLGAAAPSPARERTEQPAILSEVQRRLADHLQTRVRVEMGQRKGKIVLDFVSLDELQRLLDTIVAASETSADAKGQDPSA